MKKLWSNGFFFTFYVETTKCIGSMVRILCLIKNRSDFWKILKLDHNEVFSCSKRYNNNQNLGCNAKAITNKQTQSELVNISNILMMNKIEIEEIEKSVFDLFFRLYFFGLL
jgi:hypothetical protein